MTRNNGSTAEPNAVEHHRRKAVAKRHSSSALKVLYLEALDRLGGVEYVLKFAESNPVEFMAHLSKMLPREASIETNDTTARTWMEVAKEMRESGELPSARRKTVSLDDITAAEIIDVDVGADADS